MSTFGFFEMNLQKTIDVDGIVYMPNFLNSFDIDDLLNFYNHFSPHPESRQFHSTMMTNNASYRRIVDIEVRKVIEAKLKNLISEFRMLFANFIVKEPGGRNEIGIHQDWSFTSPEFRSLNIWIPLVDITTETGLFYALKGSHNILKNIRYTPYPDSLYDGIKALVLRASTPFMPFAGDALIYDGALIHFSDANITSKIRPAIAGPLIPKSAPNLHYYRRTPASRMLEVFEATDNFYSTFDIFNEPLGVKKINEIIYDQELPSEIELEKLIY